MTTYHSDVATNLKAHSRQRRVMESCLQKQRCKESDDRDNERWGEMINQDKKDNLRERINIENRYPLLAWGQGGKRIERWTGTGEPNSYTR